MKSFTVHRFLILAHTLTLCVALAIPPSVYGDAQKKLKFISYEVWQSLTDAEKKEIIKKLREIPFPKYRSPSSVSQIDVFFVNSVAFIGSLFIPQAEAYSAPEDRTQYKKLESEYNKKCGSSARPRTCDQLANLLEIYELRPLPNAPSKKSIPPRPSGVVKKNTASSQDPNALDTPNAQVTPTTQGSSAASTGSSPNSPDESPADELKRELAEEEAQRNSAAQATEKKETTPNTPTQKSTTPPSSDSQSLSSEQIINNARKGHNENGKNDKNDLKGDRDAAGLNHIREDQPKGPCQTSSAFGADYDCKGSESQLKTFDSTVNIIGKAAEVGAQVVGTQAAYNTQKSGTLAGGLEAGANAQDITAKSQLALGAISAAAGAWEVMKIGGKHSNHEDRFKAEMIDYKGENLVDGNNDSQNTAEAQLNQYKKNTDIAKYSKEDIQKMSNSLGAEKGDHGYLAAKNDGSLSAQMINNENGSFGDLNEKVNRINDVSYGKAYLDLKAKLDATPPTDPNYNILKGEVENARQEANNQLSARRENYEHKIHDFKKNVRSVGSEAASEQAQIADLAKAQGYSHLMIGATQMIQGYAGMKAAELNKKSAKALKNMSDNPFNFTPPSNTPIQINPGDALAGSATSISPTSGSGDSSGADSNSDNNTDGLSLGDPTSYQNERNTLANGGPSAPTFKPGDPGGGPGGGSGGGGGGGGSTSPAKNEGEDSTAPRIADSRGVPAYEGGGAYRGGGGGGSGGKDGPDLSGLLAQFLPKQGEDQGHKNGILDYGGGRAPASDDEDASLLGRNINIFERVHQAYQEKQKKRRIGI